MTSCASFPLLCREEDVERILNWKATAREALEIPFRPARVLLQDLTGVPAVADLAAMRNVLARKGIDPQKVNPLCRVDLIIDHSVQADFVGPNACEANEKVELVRNEERFRFLKWGQKAFQNLKIVPPGNGIVHQINLEHLAPVVISQSDAQGLCVFPDSVIGTDSHTTMINALGVLGWGVGGIEAEAVMLGESISMTMPDVLGVRLSGRLKKDVTATDLVLNLTALLRRHKVVGKCVEFVGPGCQSLTLPERATISNMAPEYGATVGYFPVDAVTLDYLRATRPSRQHVDLISEYFVRQNLMALSDSLPDYGAPLLEVDLGEIRPTIAGPKRPFETLLVDRAKEQINALLSRNRKGGQSPRLSIRIADSKWDIGEGAVLLAAITSCTNTSNPAALIGAGRLAKAACAKGLRVPPFVKTILAPGSKVVTRYLRQAELLQPLEALGFHVTGYGCMACIGNSGGLQPAVEEALRKAEDFVGCAVLSGNRNFESRIHPLLKANYLASPPLVVAYALAGRLNIDFDHEPVGMGADGVPVFLREIWPNFHEIGRDVHRLVTPDMFHSVYSNLEAGNPSWQKVRTIDSPLYQWEPESTYIREPPFFLKSRPKTIGDILNGHCLLWLGDAITTDHISPAGSIQKATPAAELLASMGVKANEFNTYGARRGNHEIMARGTFANKQLVNKLATKAGPFTCHVPSNSEMSIFQAAEKYAAQDVPLIVIAGTDYGQGSSRDWAAKFDFA